MENIKYFCVQSLSSVSCVSCCFHLQQQAFNAASVIHHIKKLQLSHSEPSAHSTPNIILQSSSQNHLQTLRCCQSEEGEEEGKDPLDPNGNPVPATGHLSCTNPESCRGVCPTLRASFSEPGSPNTDDQSREVHGFHSESEAHLRPSTR